MKKIIPCFILTLTMVSCLKKDDYYLFPDPTPLILVPNANWPAVTNEWFSAPPADSAYGTTRLNLYASISFEKPLTKAITVTFVKDNSVLTEFNKAWSTSYALLPENCYTVASLTLTIPAGSTDVSLPVTVIPGNFNGTDNYLLPFTISSVSDNYTIAGNRKTMLFTLAGY